MSARVLIVLAVEPLKKDQYEGAVSMLYATTAIEKTGRALWSRS